MADKQILFSAPMVRAILFLALAYLLALPALALEPGQTRQVSPSEIYVIDGDTIRYDRQSWRLVDFDTPETGSRARCEAEVKLGLEAKAYLLALIRGSARVTLTRVACACRAGTEGTMACNYGRRCGRLKVDGADVGPLLIAQRLARPYRYPGRNPPAPWCRP